MAAGNEVGGTERMTSNGRFFSKTVKFSSGTTATFVPPYKNFIVLSVVGTTNGVSYTFGAGATQNYDGSYTRPQDPTNGGLMTVTASATDSGRCTVTMLEI